MNSRMARGWCLGLVSLWLAAGCGGLSTVESEQRCDQARASDATGCIDDAAYQECVSCYEDCGDECVQATACPARFTCPE